MTQVSLETMGGAVAFAQAGEDATARALMQGERTVLLALGASGVSETLLMAAANLSARVDASLEILMSSQGAAPVVGRFVRAVRRRGIVCRLVVLKELFWETVVNHARASSQVTCVVIDSPARWGLDPSGWFPGKSLPCPLVVVGEKRGRVR